MGIGGLNPSLSAKEKRTSDGAFFFTESEGSRAEAALSPAGRCAKSAGESEAATAKQSRELAFAVGEAGANFASKFESEAAIFNYQLSTINYPSLRVASRRLIAPR